jgi:Zn-dependent protease
VIFFLPDLLDNPLAAAAFLAAFLVAVILGIGFHEFSHAWAANELGDDTAAKRGRLTLNPIVHIDPMGLLMIVVIGFGRGKPTPVNPYKLRNGPKRGGLMVAAAGPLSNFIFAATAAIPLRMGWIDSVATLDGIRDASGAEVIGLFLFFIIWMNILLGLFNLIPIPPLDGFTVLVGLLPDEMARPLSRLSQYGPMLIIGLFVISFLPNGPNPLGWFLGGLGARIFDFVL